MRKGHGFTLIELLVAIAIIALLSTIVMAGTGESRKKAQVARVLQEFRAVQNAFIRFQLETNLAALPLQDDYLAAGSPTQCDPDDVKLSGTDLYENVLSYSGWSGPYLGSVPKTPWGNEYTYDNEGNNWTNNPGDWTYGVNLHMEWCNSSDGARALDFAPRLDALMDNGDGNLTGRVRWGTDINNDRIKLLIDARGAQ